MTDNRQVIIASLPDGPLAESHFELRVAERPEPRSGRGPVSNAGHHDRSGAARRVAGQRQLRRAAGRRPGYERERDRPGRGVRRPLRAGRRPGQRTDRLAGVLGSPRLGPHRAPRGATPIPIPAFSWALSAPMDSRPTLACSRSASRSPARRSWSPRRRGRSATSSPSWRRSGAAAWSASPAQTRSAAG